MSTVNEDGESWPWRILLIEDNPADEKMVRRCLTRHGINCDLVVFDDGQQAIEFFDRIEASPRERGPDIVLLDVGLPHHNGLEVLASIRRGERFGQVPVIVMSGSEAPDLVLEATKKAAKHIFVKKADSESFLKLGNLIREVLEAGTLPG